MAAMLLGLYHSSHGIMTALVITMMQGFHYGSHVIVAAMRITMVQGFHHSCHGIMIVLMITTTRRYGPLRGPTSSSCGGLRPSTEGFFSPSGKKRAYYAVLAHFWQFFVSSSNLGNF